MLQTLYIPFILSGSWLTTELISLNYQYDMIESLIKAALTDILC